MNEALRGTGRIFERSGSAFFWIAYYHRGREIRESSKSPDRKIAERLLKRRLREIGADRMAARRFVGPEQERVRVAELLDALERDLRLRNDGSGVKSLGRLLSHLKRIRREFGDWRAVDITGEAVDRYIESRLSQGARPATVNRETALLAQCFKLAVESDPPRLSHAPKIRKLSEKGNARQGFFERADFERVVAGLPEDLRGFARFGYSSGWRKGEIAALRWSDLDRHENIIHLRPENSKNGEGRLLTLEGELLSVIERQWEARAYMRPDGASGFSPIVFHRNGSPIGDIRKAWHAACKAADVPGKLFHDLRRTAVRDMVRAGVPERVAMSVSGHKTRAIFDRYNIVSEADIRQAVRRTQAYRDTAPAERKVVSFPAK